MRHLLAAAALFVVAPLLFAGDLPCKSGLPAGKRPGPYSSLVATGEHRGQQHCFVCETGDRPAVIVFARSLSNPLGKLLHQIDGALADQKKSELRAWATFLSNDQPGLDPRLVQFGKKHSIGNVALTVFEDVVGPPAYQLSAEADVTVLVAVKQRVAGNFAFRAGQLNDAAIARVMRAVRQLDDKK
jgi:hypothetical protein